MEIDDQTISEYLKSLLEKKKIIKDNIEKNPVKGDSQSLPKRQLAMIGGLKVLDIEVNAEILGVYNFAKSKLDLWEFSEEDAKLIEEIESIKKTRLLNFVGREIKFSPHAEEFLNHIN